MGVISSVMLLYSLYLHSAKPLAIDAVGIALGYECVVVDVFYDPEYSDRFYLAAPYEQDLHIVFGIPSRPVKYCHASVGIGVD